MIPGFNRVLARLDLCVAAALLLVHLTAVASPPSPASSLVGGCQPDGSTTTQGNWTILVAVPTLNSTDLESRQVIAAVGRVVDQLNARESKSTFATQAVQVASDGWSAVINVIQQLEQAPYLAIVGLSSSAAIRRLSPLAAAAGVAVLTPYAEPDPDLSTVEYPGVFRLRPDSEFLPQAVRDVVHHYRWLNVSLIHSDVTYGDRLAWSIKDQMSGKGTPVQSSVNLQSESLGPIKQALEGIRASGIKVLIVSTSTAQLEVLLKSADQLGMLVKGYAWIVAPLATDVHLLGDDLKRLLSGALIIRASVDQKRLSNFTTEMRVAAPSSFPNGAPSSAAALYTYDAVAALDRALHKWHNQSIRQCSLAQTNSAQLGSAVLGQVTFPARPPGRQLFPLLKTVRFEGRSGLVDLSCTSNQNSYDITNWNEGESRIVSTWTEEGSLTFSSNPVVNWTGGTLVTPTTQTGSQAILRVLVPLSSPFTYLKGSASHLISSSQEEIDTIPADLFQGVAIDLLNIISQREGFKYKLTLWNGDSWNKMVAITGNASSPYDLAIGGITVNAQRSNWCNFSRSIYLSGLQMLVRRSATGAARNLWVSFGGLDWRIWLIFFFVLLGVAVLFLILDPGAVRQQKDKGRPVADSVFFAFSTFFFIQEDDRVRNPWARAFIIVLLFVILVIVAAYTATMVYTLSKRDGRKALTEFNDLPGVWVAVRPIGTSWTYVTRDLALRKVVPVNGVVEAIQSLRNGTVDAFIDDIPDLKKAAAEACDMKVAGRRVGTFFPLE